MEKNDLLNDPFLRDLVGKSTLESPSEDFVDKVMAKIQVQPLILPENKSLLPFLKSFFGFLLLAAVLIGFFWTSDIPVLSWLPGKQFFMNSVLPSFDPLFRWLKSFFGSGSGVSIPVMIMGAAGLLFLADKLIMRRFTLSDHSA